MCRVWTYLLAANHTACFANLPQIRPVHRSDKRLYLIQRSSFRRTHSHIHSPPSASIICSRSEIDTARDTVSGTRSYPTRVGREKKITRTVRDNVSPGNWKKKFEIPDFPFASEFNQIGIDSLTVTFATLKRDLTVGDFASYFTVSLAMSVPKQLSRKHNLFDL